MSKKIISIEPDEKEAVVAGKSESQVLIKPF